MHLELFVTEKSWNEPIPTSRPRRKVMIVDDEWAILQFLSLCLSGEGYEVVCAGSGAEALALLTTDFNVVVTDQKMPGMGGLELAGKIKGQFPRLPVVLMSGQFWANTGGGHFGGFLAKPFTRQQLLEALDRVEVDEGHF